MAFEEIKENFSEAEASAKSYVDSSAQFYKLKGFKVMMKAIVIFAKIALVSVMLLLALLFLSASTAFWVGEALDSNALGFLVVGGFYILVGLILFLLRQRLNKPLLKKFSEFYFDEI
ncbi:phage holin family protein [Pseudozobellia sp. WGM2]|uniref:phage holin family protein n=1 Tax=Pseudozobellia sp. WGM2 TaxID=2787625 RepID=UPI001AE05279|nr:phage holin family protein [Pseudozobellia sp. WGM2]